ncbi:hypothetical protein PV342_38475 [Streptomyces sp. PA03-3a]|nr:hypothetical protein [Streptomyces sp. PA03-3a]
MPQLGAGGDERLEPERAERSAVVGDDRDQRLHRAVGVPWGKLCQRPAGQPRSFCQGKLDGGDRVVLVCGGRDVPAQFVLRPVIAAAGQPPGAAGGGLELGEVQLPDLVRADRLAGERRLAPRRELPTFALVVRLQQQTLVAQQP